MTVDEVISFVAGLVGDKDIEGVIGKIREEEALTPAERKTFRRYLSGINIAVDTIASRYYTMQKELFVTTGSESSVEYSSLSERVCDVLSVRDMAGNKVEFYVLPFSLCLPKRNTRYLVKFRYLPKEVRDVNDELELLPFVPLEAVGYLMASDILLAKRLYDEAKFWFAKFESVMQRVLSTRRMRTLMFDKLI